MALVRIISRVLGMPEQDLEQECVEGDRISLLRLFHYFGTGADNEFSSCSGGQKCIGSSPHTDWGFLTIVGFDPSDQGLEIFHNNSWHSVQVEGGSNVSKRSVLINFGDYLSVASKGRLLSPLHRVVSQPSERYSFVYFFYPNYDTSLSLEKANLGDHQRLSLLQEQSAREEGQADVSAHEAGRPERIESFGEYIRQKWAQVFRQAPPDAHSGNDKEDL